MKGGENDQQTSTCEAMVSNTEWYVDFILHFREFLRWVALDAILVKGYLL